MNKKIYDIYTNVKLDYTESDYIHINNTKNIIIESQDSLSNILTEIITANELEYENILIGRILDKNAEKIKKDIGIDLKNYSFVYNKSNIKHIYKEHIINNKKQIQLEVIDLLLFPYIFQNYDIIAVATNGKILVEKWVDDNFRVIASFSIKRKNIVLNTIFKVKKRGINLSQPLMIQMNPYQVLRP